MTAKFTTPAALTWSGVTAEDGRPRLGTRDVRANEDDPGHGVVDGRDRVRPTTGPGQRKVEHTIGEVGWPGIRPPHTGSGPCCYRLDVAGSVPWRTTNPEGVCIQELFAMIQVEDRTVPIETITVEQDADEPASTKNAVTTSIPSSRPWMEPAFAANTPQFGPISNVITMPATTP